VPQEYVPAPSIQVTRPKAYISDEEGRYSIIAPRFIDGEIIEASPETPAVITLPAGSKIDCDLTPLKEGQEPAKLKPAHAGNIARKKTSAAERFGRPPAAKE
jgi:hypothetical protein